MSDSDLEAKFMGLAEGVLPPAKTKRLIDLLWRVEKLQGAGELVKAAAA